MSRRRKLSTNPSAILATTAEIYADEAKRLREKARKKALTPTEWRRLRELQEDQALLESTRADKLLVLLGAKLNVKDWSPDQLEAVAKSISSGDDVA